MSIKETIKRYIVLTVGMFFTALGVAFSKHGGLGVSTISSVPNVLSCYLPHISLGAWMTVWNFVMVAGQIAILRKDFKLTQFLQIPLSFVFGYFTDLGLNLISYIPIGNYITQLLLVFVGIWVLAFGVSLTFTADVVMNPGEGIVKAISDVTHISLGNAKTMFDIFCVTSALVLSLIFFEMKIVGTREGTVLAASLTGTIVKFLNKRIQPHLNSFFEKEN